jgi:hypothetical protein
MGNGDVISNVIVACVSSTGNVDFVISGFESEQFDLF